MCPVPDPIDCCPDACPFQSFMPVTPILGKDRFFAVERDPTLHDVISHEFKCYTVKKGCPVSPGFLTIYGYLSCSPVNITYPDLCCFSNPDSSGSEKFNHCPVPLGSATGLKLLNLFRLHMIYRLLNDPVGLDLITRILCDKM